MTGKKVEAYSGIYDDVFCENNERLNELLFLLKSSETQFSDHFRGNRS